MSDDATTILSDAFGRIDELVRDITDDLDASAAAFRVDAEANTPAWLVWHLTRIQDDHVADLAGVNQRWEQWRARFDLPFDDHDTGFGHDPEDVAEVRGDGSRLAGYHADVHAMTVAYLEGLTSDELARVVDEGWDPPVTVAARLVSVLGDCWQHLGQAAFVVGVARRRG